MNWNNKELLKRAWLARENAYPWKSATKVGCVLQMTNGDIYSGWNIEGLWMTSIHAEVCAISHIGNYKDKIKKVVIVAEVGFFTPCGACLDWLIQFAEEDCEIIIQNKDRIIYKFGLGELCPHYPKK